MAKTIQYQSTKVSGLMFGTFIGDACGAAFDGASPDDIPPLDNNYILANPPKSYTDDTQMAISVFEEMTDNGHIDQQSLLGRFLKRFAPWRGYSGGMLEVIERWRDGCDIESTAKSLYGGLGSFGDGAAMRAGPISAFFKIDEIEQLIEQVRLCSVLTHTHPYGIGGAVLQAYAVLLALNNVPVQEWMARFYSFPIESAFKIRLEKVERCLGQVSSPHDSAREIGNGSDATEAVPAAFFSVMRHPNSFADAVLFAISMGGDTDTIGAMTGAIAGALHGIEGIPQEWMRDLENGAEGKDFISGLVKKASL